VNGSTWLDDHQNVFRVNNMRPAWVPIKIRCFHEEGKKKKEEVGSEPTLSLFSVKVPVPTPLWLHVVVSDLTPFGSAISISKAIA
jgi:hypothetical protein